jgi:hypothetical protein
MSIESHASKPISMPITKKGPIRPCFDDLMNKKRTVF